LKIARAKEDAYRQAEEEKLAILRKVQENEEYRKKILESRNNQLKQSNESNNNQNKEKLLKIREINETAVQEKTKKVLNELEYKEKKTAQELEKIKEFQNKRKIIKSIKQEAVNISLLRIKKADEYKKLKLENEIQKKFDRCDAIKNGFSMLNQMRSDVQDIVLTTNFELQNELEKLQLKNEFSPEKVMKKVFTVSNELLFPKLKKTFGFSTQQPSTAPSLLNNKTKDNKNNNIINNNNNNNEPSVLFNNILNNNSTISSHKNLNENSSILDLNEHSNLNLNNSNLNVNNSNSNNLNDNQIGLMSSMYSSIDNNNNNSNNLFNNNNNNNMNFNTKNEYKKLKYRDITPLSASLPIQSLTQENFFHALQETKKKIDLQDEEKKNLLKKNKI